MKTTEPRLGHSFHRLGFELRPSQIQITHFVGNLLNGRVYWDCLRWHVPWKL